MVCFCIAQWFKNWKLFWLGCGPIKTKQVSRGSKGPGSDLTWDPKGIPGTGLGMCPTFGPGGSGSGPKPGPECYSDSGLIRPDPYPSPTYRLVEIKYLKPYLFRRIKDHIQ
ncbi:hypothetical protein AMTRI_Chr13g84310 [Amborella trichopoda]